MKNAWQNTLLILFSLMIALTGIEISMRLLAGNDLSPKTLKYRTVSGSNRHTYHPTYGWTTVPSARVQIKSPEYDITVENNSHGTRGPEYRTMEATSSCRVHVVGDSFIAGYTVNFEEMFTQIAQRILKEQLGHECELIADGVEGFSTDQQLLRYRDLGKVYNADHVVLAVFFNDIHQNAHPVAENLLPKPFYRVDEQRLQLSNIPVPVVPDESSSTAPTDPSTIQRILRRFRVAVSGPFRLRTLIRSTLAERRLTEHEIPLRSALFRREIPDYWEVYAREKSLELAPAFELTERLILEFRNEVEANGATFTILHVPNRSLIYDEDWQWARVYHGLDASWNLGRIEEFLSDICIRHKISCILPADELLAVSQAGEDSSERLYLRNDIHWSRRGHKVMGELFARYLLKSVVIQ